MSSRVLFVDDDLNLLAACERNLRKRFLVHTAPGAEQGLAKLAEQTFSVVVSDFRMPGMDGIQFLARVKESAPDTVRILLTGNADHDTAISAINEGSIFRFLSKPCDLEMLAKVLEAGIAQHRLVTAERELLEKTLNGSIKLLTDILSMVMPQAFDRAITVRESAKIVARAMGLKRSWDLELAAMFSRIGHVTIPSEVAVKAGLGQKLTPDEQQILARVPEIGGNLLANIPRLDPVARIVLYQAKRYDGTGFPRDTLAGEDIPLGSRILNVLNDLHELEAGGATRSSALEELKQRSAWYDPKVLEAVTSCFGRPSQARLSDGPTIHVPVAHMLPGDVLASDVETRSGMLLIASGAAVTPAVLERLRNYAKLTGIKEPIRIFRTVAPQNEGAALPREPQTRNRT